MLTRLLPVFCALLLFSCAIVPTAHAREADAPEPMPIRETMPTIYLVKDAAGTSAPVMDPVTGSVLGFLPRKAEIVTFGRNDEVVMISLNRRTAVVPLESLEPKYPLEPEKPEFKITPGGFEKEVARRRELAKQRRSEPQGLAPRAVATPFGFVRTDTNAQQGQQGGQGGRAPAGGDGI